MTDHAETVRSRRIDDADLALRVIAAAIRVKLHERDLLDECRLNLVVRERSCPAFASVSALT
jgi:hypothetical protein